MLLTPIPSNMKELFWKYLNEECAPQELKELLACFSVENESTLKALITANLEGMDAEDKNEESRLNPVTDKILAVIKAQINSENKKVVASPWVRVRTTLQQPK